MSLGMLLWAALGTGCVDLSPPWNASGGAAGSSSAGAGGQAGSLDDTGGAGGAATGGASGVVPAGGGGHGGSTLDGSTNTLDGATVDLPRSDGALDGSPAPGDGAGDRALDLPLGGAGGSVVDVALEVASSGGVAGTGGSAGRDGVADGPLASGGSSGGAVTGGNGGSSDAAPAAGGTSGDAASVCSGYVASGGSGGVAQGLVAFYPCEQASGTLLPDSSGKGNDGTLVTGSGGASGYAFAAGKVGNALDLLVAHKGYVTVPSALLANACEATVAAWVYLNTETNWQRIFDFGKDTNVYMFLATQNSLTGVLRFAISTAGNSASHEQHIDGTAALPTGAWHHVAVVLGAAGGVLYLDGVQVGANASMTLRPADLGIVPNAYIGKSQFSADPYLDGNVDEFRVYDRALSATEIGTLAGGT